MKALARPTPSRVRHLLFAPGLAMLLSACDPDAATPPPSAVPSTEGAVVGGSSVPGFLETTDAEMHAWLEERFEAEYRNMTPPLIFQQEPIARMQYDLRGLPTDAPLFHYASRNVSRREILEAVSRFFDLQMTLQGSNGRMTHILVEGASVRPSAPLPIATIGGSGAGMDGGVPVSADPADPLIAPASTLPPAPPPPLLNQADESVLLPPEP